MYHARFKGTQLFKHGKILLYNVPFPVSQERISFGERCRPFYEKWYPEVLARNSDFLTETEKWNMNCIYKFSNGSNAFQGNTTAFVEMEDGINEYGLAIGLTSVCPKVLGFGSRLH